MSYTVLETIYEGQGTTLYRALRDADRLPVVLKVCDPARCHAKDPARLRNEYLLSKTLDTPSIVKPLSLESHQGMPTLVLEDFGGQSLERLLAVPMAVSRFLELAGRITGAVADLHRQGIVHKDLKPPSILFHPATGEVKLTNLGLASRLPREQPSAQPPGLIEGSLPYMSPEQTGRTNRAIDNRADLYSLGVTFYQMLTGRLPFEARDPVEWVHCHVARAPSSPSVLVPAVPETIARIVLKLLSKMPEDRYQSSRGLGNDWERCQTQWRKSGRIELFALGERDLSDRLHIPQKLYGREAELALLLQSFGRVVAGGMPELLLVSGYSGIGKSSLVHELLRPVVRARGFFAAGKFDQYSRDIPYSTLVQAFQGLVLEILAESEERIAAWRLRLLGTLGINAQLIVEAIPPVELIIGRQPPAPKLPLAEAQNRFRMVFRNFIGVFAQKEHPLALFLDDLQWADLASLGLLKEVVVHSELRHLLVIGAYRDNEVSALHPLLLTLDEVRKAGGCMSQVVLGPMLPEHLAAFLSDALHCRREEAAPLAELCHGKTAGNPLFAIQFLTSLHEEGLIELDEGAGVFRWDEAKIHAKNFTDNVVDLMVGKLRRLPKETQNALKLLACLGNRAEGPLLSMIHDGPDEDTHTVLWEAVHEGLVFRLDGRYKFLHDRVQEAAYSLIPEAERAAAHLQLGRLLSSRTAPEAIEEMIFEIVNQFNRGAALITLPEERERVAELNLTAGKRAKGFTAYASALKYLAAGAALLPQDCWERRYTLTFSIEFHLAECEFLTGDLTAATKRLAMLSHSAGNLIDLAVVTCARVNLFATLDRCDRSVEVGLEYLWRVGVQWSPHPTKDQVRQEFERIWQQLGSRSIEELVDLPLMSDAAWHATMDVLTTLLPPALFTDENLFFLVVARMANLSLEHGNSDGSCLAYVWLGLLLGPHFGDYQAAFRFGQLGFDLVEKRGLDRFKARVYLEFSHVANPWMRHIHTGPALARRAFDAANEIGDPTFAAFSSCNLISALLATGDPLGEVQLEAETRLEFVRKAQFGLVIDVITGQLRLIWALRGLTANFSTFNDADFDEGRFERHLEEDPGMAGALCWYWIRKLQGRFFAGDYASSVLAASKMEQFLWTVRAAPGCSGFPSWPSCSACPANSSRLF